MALNKCSWPEQLASHSRVWTHGLWVQEVCVCVCVCVCVIPWSLQNQQSGMFSLNFRHIFNWDSSFPLWKPPSTLVSLLSVHCVSSAVRSRTQTMTTFTQRCPFRMKKVDSNCSFSGVSFEPVSFFQPTKRCLLFNPEGSAAWQPPCSDAHTVCKQETCRKPVTSHFPPHNTHKHTHQKCADITKYTFCVRHKSSFH